jgi:hypothetical protein
MYQEKMVVVVSVGGRILREREVNGDGSNVYLPYGSEYSLRFKNLYSRKALLKVSIDGQDVLDGHGLILEGNTEANLERFITQMDKGNKFRFIQKTQEIADHRGDKLDDGIIRIEWQYELPCPIYYGGLLRSSSPFVQPYNNFLVGGSVGHLSSAGANTRDIIGGSINNISHSQEILCSAGLPSGSTSDSFCDSQINADTLDGFHADEGITVKGSVSNQKFTNGYIGQLEIIKHVITFKLHGTNQTLKEVVEPLTVNTKIKCPTCGRNSKSGSKFCSNCSTALEAAI